MYEETGNYAFVDGQNLHLGTTKHPEAIVCGSGSSAGIFKGKIFSHKSLLLSRVCR